MFTISTDLADRRAPRQSRSGVARTAVAGVLLTLAVIPCLLPTGAAQATARVDESGRHSVRVAYGDLNLAQPEGRMALKRRISRAAREACGIATPGATMGDLRGLACMRYAISGARPQAEAAIAAHSKAG